jgi:hypothetical protein
MKRTFVLVLALLALCIVTSGAATAATCYRATIYGYDYPDDVQDWYVLAYDDGDFVDDAGEYGYWGSYGSLMFFQYKSFSFFMSGTKKAGFWSEDYYVYDYALKKLGKKDAYYYCGI